MPPGPALHAGPVCCPCSSWTACRSTPDVAVLKATQGKAATGRGGETHPQRRTGLLDFSTPTHLQCHTFTDPSSSPKALLQPADALSSAVPDTQPLTRDSPAPAGACFLGTVSTFPVVYPPRLNIQHQVTHICHSFLCNTFSPLDSQAGFCQLSNLCWSTMLIYRPC